MFILRHFRVFVVGFMMGAADLVPGVSGGTIAFICGIYDRLIEGIKAFDLKALRLALRFDGAALWRKIPVVFFLCLGTGLLTAIFTLSGLLTGLFVSHPVELWSFFFGLVLASILLLARDTWRWRAPDWVAFVVAALATFWLVGLPVMQTPPGLPYIFLAGAIAICAMILPGISGSYLLVIMGKYQEVLAAVSERDFLTLAVFVGGIATGILSFVRIVSWLLHRFRRITLIALTGIMAGALRTVWPWKETLSTRIDSDGKEVPLMQSNVAPPDLAAMGPAFLCLLLGVVVVFAISRLAPSPAKSSG